MNFNIFTSKTFWGALATAIGAVSQCDWSKGVPYLCIVTAVGGLLAVVGVRDAIASNGAAATVASAVKANGAS